MLRNSPAIEHSINSISREPAPPAYLSINDLGRRWFVCRQTVYTVISDHSIKTIKIGARRLIPLSEIDRFEQSLIDQGGSK